MELDEPLQKYRPEAVNIKVLRVLALWSSSMAAHFAFGFLSVRTVLMFRANKTDLSSSTRPVVAVQLTRVISTSLISNNHLSRSENLAPTYP